MSTLQVGDATVGYAVEGVIAMGAVAALVDAHVSESA